MVAPARNVEEIFPPPFKVTGKSKLLNYCTNELGHFLNNTANALVGNPLRIIPLDGLNTPQKQIACANSPTSVGLNCSERYLSLTNGCDLSVYDLQKGSTLRELHDHDGNIGGVAWHRESPWLLASVGDDCTLRLWDLRSHPAQIAIRRSTKPYRRLEFSPDCNFIACAGELVSIYELCMAQNVVHMLSSSPSVAVRFNPSEYLLATAGDDRTVRFWDIDTGECVTQSPTFDAQIGHIHFEPDGKYLIVETERQIATIRWEPFELLSQFNHAQQLHFPFMPTPNPSGLSLLTNEVKESQRLTLLDMNVKNGRLYQLVVEQSLDPAKCATVYSASLSLNQLDKCGIAASSIVEKGGISAQGLFGNDLEPVDKKDGELTPEAALSSTPSSLLDSLIIDQEEDDGTDQKSLLSVQNNRRNVSVAQRSGVSSMTDGAMPKPEHRQQISTSVADHPQELQSSTSQFHRPNRLIIVPNSSSKNSAGHISSINNNRPKPSSLIRRGSSLNDVANCASASVHNTLAATHNLSPSMPTNSFGVAKAPVRQSHFSSSTMYSSSNASSNASSSSVGRDGEGTIKRRSESQVRSVEEFMQVNPKLKASAHKLKIEAGSLLSSLNSIQLNKAEHIVSAVAYFEELHIFAKLLNDYVRQPRDQTLALSAAFLPRVELLLKHRNSAYPQMALAFLEIVLSSHGDAIRHGLSSRDFSIGVDIAAEQRFDRCTKCKNALLQIRMNSSYCVDRLDIGQRQRFEALMALVDNLFGSSLGAQHSCTLP
ncbi:Katanin p80 WD40 repeat-containing subunit B1 [Globodera pallida]|nr:Katanin p80 WD40 repeat-containing subunit B1 [Globodera pallida]